MSVPATLPLIVFAVLRTLLALALITIGMLLVPDTLEADGPFPMIITVTLGLAAWVLYMRWSVKGIRKARHPKVRSAEALIVSIWLFISMFSSFYVTISASDPSSFTEPLNHFTASYFALTVLATVGFGDITPTTTLARSIAMVQMSLDLFIIAVAVRVLTNSANEEVKQRELNSQLAEQEMGRAQSQ